MGCISSKKPEINPEDLQFLIDSTSFDEKQIKDWYRGFMKDCPDGILTKDKFIGIYKQFFPNGRAESFCEHVFRAFDTDKSGKIDFREFLQAINITSQGNPKTKLEMAFRMYDIDGNGTIDKDEMRKIINAIYDLLGDDIREVQRDYSDSPESRVELIFSKMDQNGDGVLTKEEFIQGCMNDKALYQMLTQCGETSDESPDYGGENRL